MNLFKVKSKVRGWSRASGRGDVITHAGSSRTRRRCLEENKDHHEEKPSEAQRRRPPAPRGVTEILRSSPENDLVRERGSRRMEIVELILSILSLCPAVSVCGGFVESPSSLRSFSGTQTRLPCRFLVEGEETVVQVTWTRLKPGGEREQIITGHYTEGPKGAGETLQRCLQPFLLFVKAHLVFLRNRMLPQLLLASPGFQERFRFEGSEATLDSTLLIRDTQRGDQALYTCSVTIFPSGNFQTQRSLSVWMFPVSSVEPALLAEGDPPRSVASCRSVAHPPASVWWDTRLPGYTHNTSGADGQVTAEFHTLAQPVRSMNGARLDCLVSHPLYETPHRIPHTLSVRCEYPRAPRAWLLLLRLLMVRVSVPPDAEVTGSGPWRTGSTGSHLKCVANGNPPAQNFTWSRTDGALPEGAQARGDSLLFTRPLEARDEGVYVCQAENALGRTSAMFSLQLTQEGSESSWSFLAGSETLLMSIGASIATALVVFVIFAVIYVNCHLRRKNRKLKRVLSTRTEEMISLSRQVSMRRLNSITSDPRIQTEESSLMHADSVMKNSVLSVQDPHRLVEGDYDSLGRPAIYSSFRASRKLRELEEERNERRRRVESFVRSSNISLDSALHREQLSSPRPPSVSLAMADGWKRGSRRDIHPQEPLEKPPHLNSPQISEALSSYFQCSDAALNPNASLPVSSHRHIV
ncbi:hypothetical protein DNTS_031633 [Danionella cerebrum]|uniref:Ig-like domain-containing protein n=1 Tax=Danionella cerebrum TaxID=2873325 RepID=A0A553QVX0_9TELE|nr:hypothetical protein DNTS_031633 [Danionella translucida]